ncbi:hypothetical protein [Amycolatopsis sp. WGS_07]|uniref:hypothetical protein n=1 Tax=Amycolatopsis sp. WGS_07 TaxID=3076764 RepID=UPI0038734E2D
MDRAEDRFAAAMNRAGMEVPDDLREGTFAAFRELTAMAGLMRQPRAAESEPAGQFRLDVLLPGADR